MLKTLSPSDKKLFKAIIWLCAITLAAIVILVAAYRLGGRVVLLLVGVIGLVVSGTLFVRRPKKPVPSAPVGHVMQKLPPTYDDSFIDYRLVATPHDEPPDAELARTRLHWFWRFGPDLMGYILASAAIACGFVLWRNNTSAQIVLLILVAVLIFFPWRFLARATIRTSIRMVWSAGWWIFGIVTVIALLAVLISIVSPIDAMPSLRSSKSFVLAVFRLAVFGLTFPRMSALSVPLTDSAQV